MVGSIEHPAPTPRAVRTADPEELRRVLADDLRVDRRRLFLTHGATEANAAVLQFLARRPRSGRRTCRVAWPEYPDLADTARWAGFRPTDAPGPAAVAVLSQPRNPEGDLWAPERLLRWAEAADQLLVDETFREFAGAPSLAGLLPTRLWLTGTFTKFYAGDDIRVGFLVAPENAVVEFAQYHALVLDRLANYSVASALAALRARPRIRREVERVLAPNRAAWTAAFPGEPVPVGPVAFDRRTGLDGDALARACLAASVLVCPGRLFGAPRGVRLGLTRRTFPRDLGAYLTVRDDRARRATGRTSRRSPSPSARRLRAGTDRGRGGPA